ncbi:hypothetical protein E4U43_005177, partial [Claviceps pusilla]
MAPVARSSVPAVTFAEIIRPFTTDKDNTTSNLSNPFVTSTDPPMADPPMGNK